MKIIMWQVVVVLYLTKIVFVFPTLYSGRLFFLKLRVHIKDNDNSPHGKVHRFLFAFSSKFPDLRPICSLYLLIYSCYETCT